MKKLLNGLLIFIPALMPSYASACAVCFGGDNKDLSMAYNWGILIMLVFTFAILASLIYFLVSTEMAKAKEDELELKLEREHDAAKTA